MNFETDDRFIFHNANLQIGANAANNMLRARLKIESWEWIRIRIFVILSYSHARIRVKRRGRHATLCRSALFAYFIMIFINKEGLVITFVVDIMAKPLIGYLTRRKLK